jgi:hypothetical protein
VKVWTWHPPTRGYAENAVAFRSDHTVQSRGHNASLHNSVFGLTPGDVITDIGLNVRGPESGGEKWEIRMYLCAARNGDVRHLAQITIKKPPATWSTYKQPLASPYTVPDDGETYYWTVIMEAFDVRLGSLGYAKQPAPSIVVAEGVAA